MSAEKILGIIPKNRYMYFAYMFLLLFAAGNALYALLGAVGLHFDSASFALMIMGALSLILAILGLTVSKKEFAAVDHAHFKYIAINFVAFFIINILFGATYMLGYVIGFLCTLGLGVLQTILVWTGFSAWQEGRVLTMASLKSEMQIALKKR